MATYLAEDQTRKIELIGDIKAIAKQIEFPPVDPNPVDVPELDRTIWSFEGYCRLALPKVKDTELELYKHLDALRASIVELRRRLLLGDRKEISQKLAEFQQALFNDVRETFEAIQNQNNSERLRPQDLPEALRNRFIGVHGKLLIQVYPKKDISGAKTAGGIHPRSAQGRSRGDRHTCATLRVYDAPEKQLRAGGRYSAIAIALLVFIHFRKISCVVLSLIPVGIGGIWLVKLRLLPYTV